MASHLSRAEFSALIGRLYDCALEPELWPVMMDELCRLVDGLNSSLFVLDLETQRARFGLWQGMDPAEREKLQNMHSSDAGFQPLRDLANPAIDPDEPFVFNRIVSKELKERSEIRKDWIERFGIVDSIGTLVMREPNRLGIWTAARHKSVGEFTDREVDIMREVAPHLRRAVTISDILDARRIEGRALLETLDTLSAAVAIVGEKGKVLVANKAAERQLRSDGTLTSKNGQLAARSAASSNAFSDALAQALRGDDAIGKAGIGVPLVNARAEVASAFMLPLDMSDVRTRLVPQAMAAVFVTGIRESFDGLDELRVLHQLTPAEVRVVEQLVKGLSVAEVARELGNAEATVRTHLARIFSKTGTSRQGELIALAARLVSPLSRG